MKKSFDIGFSGNWKENLDKNNCLYIITNTINNKKYIGIAKSLRHRLYNYKYEVDKTIKKRSIVNAIIKYGINNFSFDFIKSTKDYNSLLQEEIKYISDLKKDYILYNETDGGDGFIGAKRFSGSKIYNSKLNSNIIEKVFNLVYEEKIPIIDICKSFGFKPSLIYSLLNGKTYKEESKIFIKKYSGYKRFTPKNKNIGSNNYQSKLNKNDIKNIFNIYHNEKLNCINIANKYNVNKSTISKILLGKIYKEESKDLINIFPKPRKSTNHINYKLNSGELNNKSKLKENQVKEILYMFYIKKIKVKEIKNIFKITESTIYDLLKGKTWKDLYKDFILRYDI